MKKIVLLFSIFPLMFTSIFAQDSAEKLVQLKKLNQQTIVYYQQGNLKEATKTAQEVLELSKEIYGNEDVQTAVSYYNLGEIYKARKKYDEAAENLQVSLNIYQKQPEQYEEKIAQILESLGVVLTLDGKFNEAQSVIEDSVKTAEEAFKGQDRKLLSYYKTANYFYMFAKKYEKAANFFGKRYKATKKVYGEESNEIEDIENELDCYLSKFDSESKKQFRTIYRNAKTDDEEKKLKDDSDKDVEVVNGKAISLPKPVYPYTSRRMGVRGEVMVRVLINENGDVIKAKAFCGGDELLRDSSEKAALKAKFRPTTLSGVPVKVSGIITYVFN